MIVPNQFEYDRPTLIFKPPFIQRSYYVLKNFNAFWIIVLTVIVIGWGLVQAFNMLPLMTIYKASIDFLINEMPIHCPWRKLWG
jgi:hypothetical protein